MINLGVSQPIIEGVTELSTDVTDRNGNLLPTIILTPGAPDINWRSYDFADFYLSQLSTAPGSTIEGAVEQLIADRISAGLWVRDRCIWLMNMNGTLADAGLNLKYPVKTPDGNYLNFTGSPTAASTGVTFNGTSQYANTYYPRNYMPIHDFSMSVYSRTNSNPSGVHCDIAAGNSGLSAIIIKDQGVGTAIFMNGNNSVVGAVSSSEGLFTASVRSATDAILMKNASSSLATISSVASTENLTQIIIAGRYEGTSFIQLTAREYALAHIGLGLTDTQIADHYNSIQDYMTTCGIQV